MLPLGADQLQQDSQNVSKGDCIPATHSEGEQGSDDNKTARESQGPSGSAGGCAQRHLL